jgi:hypothetical protein
LKSLKSILKFKDLFYKIKSNLNLFKAFIYIYIIFITTNNKVYSIIIT